MGVEINIPIKKASGEISEFSPAKLKHSLLRAGASEQQANDIAIEIENQLYPGISTKKIFQQAFKLLKRSSKPIAGKYKLKNAIMELGPSGFPFEKYFAAILQQQGYKVQTGVMMQGHCVKHEVDVVAEKAEKHFMIECKFHHQGGQYCNVKIPLYIYSRFKDLEKWLIDNRVNEDLLHQGWVVTNTRFTTDAIQYGTCAGLKMIGWNYPYDNSLNKQIDESGLYPITCLNSLTKSEKQSLLNKEIVLCTQICENPQLLKHVGITDHRIHLIMQEASELCKGAMILNV